jgi:sec-independent protein translocase protein TatB
MFEVGFQELVLLFVIGLLVLGPERLPKVATALGKWVGRARRTASHLRHQLEREIALAELEERRKKQANQQTQPPGTHAGGAEPPKTVMAQPSAGAAGKQDPAPGAAGPQDPPPAG